MIDKERVDEGEKDERLGDQLSSDRILVRASGGCF